MRRVAFSLRREGKARRYTNTPFVSSTRLPAFSVDVIKRGVRPQAARIEPKKHERTPLLIMQNLIGDSIQIVAPGTRPPARPRGGTASCLECKCARLLSIFISPNKPGGKVREDARTRTVYDSSAGGGGKKSTTESSTASMPTPLSAEPHTIGTTAPAQVARAIPARIWKTNVGVRGGPQAKSKVNRGVREIDERKYGANLLIATLQDGGGPREWMNIRMNEWMNGKRSYEWNSGLYNSLASSPHRRRCYRMLKWAAQRDIPWSSHQRQLTAQILVIFL